MNKFIQAVDGLSEYSGRIVAYLIIPLILTIVYSTLIRFFFNVVVDWAFEMSMFMNGIMVMVGGAYTLKYKAHVRVDVITHYLGPAMNRRLDILSFVIIIAVCLVLTYFGGKAAWVSTLRLEYSSLQTPFNPQIWWYKWFIPFSASLLALQALVECMRTIKSKDQ